MYPPRIRPYLYKACVAQCEVCGGHVEEHGFQVLVSGRPSAYDRIECAERGRVLAAAGGAAFVHPFKARTIVIDAPRAAVAAAASAGVAGSLLARASLARAKLAFGGVWLLATGLAATSLYLSTRPGSAGRSAGSGAAEVPTGVQEPASSVPFVHQADLPPVRAVGPTRKPAGPSKSKPQPQPLLVRNDSGNQPSPVATPSSPPPPQSAPSPAPAQEPPPPPAIQPVEPPPPAIQPVEPPPVAAPTGDDDEGSTKPGWGHGDDNHAHGGPPGKDKDR
jgi:hypothetical protein